MRPMPILTVALAALAACASAPKINYFTLGTASPGSVAGAVNLSIGSLRTAPELGRRQIMASVSPTRIEYYAADHWVGEVGDLVRQRLAAAFGPAVEGRRTVGLSGTVLACGEVDGPAGHQAHLKLEIEFREAGTPLYRPPLLVRSYDSITVVDGPGVAPVVDELARAVDRIAAKIARDAAALPSGEGD